MKSFRLFDFYFQFKRLHPFFSDESFVDPSLQDALQRASERHNMRNYPLPDRPESHATNNFLSVNILILPDMGVEGMLENLIFDALRDDIVTECVDDYFACLADKTGELRKNILPKAQLRAFIAGKAVDAKNTKADTEIWEPGLIYNRASWWQDDYWKHEAFDRIKIFLRQMVE